MYNFINQLMSPNRTHNRRTNFHNTQLPFNLSNTSSRYNRNSTFIGNELMHTLYHNTRQEQPNNTHIENRTIIQNENLNNNNNNNSQNYYNENLSHNNIENVPIFQTNLAASLNDALDGYIDDDMDLPIIEYTNNIMEETNDISSAMQTYIASTLNDVAQIVPGSDDVTFYMNFPNEDQEENSSLFYTIFETSRHRIQYNHDQLLSYSECEALYNHILNTMNTDDNIEGFINDTLHESDSTYSRFNDESSIQKMKTNILYTSYAESRTMGLLNDTCPITYEEFKHDDEVCLFMHCKHGINSSQIDEYLLRFCRCPLCNRNIE